MTEQQVESHVPTGYEIGRGGDGLTARERQVLFLIGEGHANAEIGRRLGLSKQRVGQIRKVLVDKDLVIMDGLKTWVAAKKNS